MNVSAVVAGGRLPGGALAHGATVGRHVPDVSNAQVLRTASALPGPGPADAAL